MDNWLLKILHSTNLGMPNVIVFARLASCVKRTRMVFERFYGCPTDKGLFGHGDCRERAVGSALECPTRCLEKIKEKGILVPYTLYPFCECITTRWWDRLGMPEGTLGELSLSFALKRAQLPFQWFTSGY